MNRMRKYVFWLLARTALIIYSRLPIFGRLRAAVGIIENNDTYLVIERNDGRGISFPGGLALPWESAEKAAAREIHEETGLRVTKSTFHSCYDSSHDIPVNITVFRVEADGQIRGSWEGTPRWADRDELRQRLLHSQRRIVETLPNQPAG